MQIKQNLETKVEIEITSKLPREWDELVANSSYPSVFFTRAWLGVLEKSFDYYRPRFICAWSEGKLLGGMPVFDVSKFGVHKVLSLPLSYGGPLVRKDAGADAGKREENHGKICQAVFLAFAENFRFPASLRQISLPYHSPFERDAQILEKFGFSKSHFDKLVLTLDGEGAEGETRVWMEKIDRKRRNAIRKAEREGVETRELQECDFDQAWMLIEETTRRLGVKPDSKDFIKSVFREMRSAGLSKWLCAFHDGEMVGVSAFFYYRNRAVYFQNASKKEEGLSASSLLLWLGVKEALSSGVKFFDLGSADAQLHPTLRKFKESFGAEPVSCTAYSKYTALYSAAIKSRKLFSKLGI